MSVWTEAKRGDVWVDAKKQEHAIVGVVQDGFDAVCNGVPENFRSKAVVGRDHDVEVVKAAGGDEDAQKAAAPRWVDLDAAIYAAVEGWKLKGV